MLNFVRENHVRVDHHHACQISLRNSRPCVAATGLNLKNMSREWLGKDAFSFVVAFPSSWPRVSPLSGHFLTWSFGRFGPLEIDRIITNYVMSEKYTILDGITVFLFLWVFQLFLRLYTFTDVTVPDNVAENIAECNDT